MHALGIRDPAIKLFGQTIPLPADDESPAVSCDGDTRAVGDEDSDRDLTSEEENKGSEIEEEKDIQVTKPSVTGTETKEESAAPPLILDQPMDPEKSQESSHDDTPKVVCTDEQNCSSAAALNEDTNTSQEKTLKKPDKIVPCPRCKSMETKFCYYNNYNVNQPRHFCKGCQRYWTDGGTMRNVPVGAGRRKNKNWAAAESHYRHMTISNALHHQTPQFNTSSGFQHPNMKSTSSTLLSFGSAASSSLSLSETMSPLLEKTSRSGARDGPHKLDGSEVPVPVPSRVGENSDDPSSGVCSTITGSSSVEELGKNGAQEPPVEIPDGFPPQIPCLPGIPWAYPAFCHPAFPMVYPAASYWHCAFPGAWTVPLLSTSSSSPCSQTLGKHSRDEESHDSADDRKEEIPTQRNVWFPKTKRIDDPDEAAMSSIWATLGIKNDSITKGGLFQGFQPKCSDAQKNHVNETSPVLLANPAALSRSLNFRESS